jgi:4-hydroxy-3-polyprenylbenzoate decarboxylase
VHTITCGKVKVKRIIVGISGASGVVYGIRFLEILRQYPEIESHLVITDTAREIIPFEMSAPIASGSFATDGMIVVPCSVKSMSGIAHSFSENLLIRAADVTIKEGHNLILVVRETPLHLGHLKTMVRLAEMGAVILPPIPAFYHHPATIEDVILHTIGKVLDQLRIPHTLFSPWQGPNTVKKEVQGE